MDKFLGQDINEKDRWNFLLDNSDGIEEIGYVHRFTPEEIEVEIYADVDGREVSLSLVSAGANEAIEEYKDKVINEQIEMIKSIDPNIVIIEI